MACPFLFIILQEKGKIKLHLGYKSGISFSKVASRIQKLHFVYKYSVVTLQSGVSAYKVASRFSIKQQIRYRNAITPDMLNIIAKNQIIIVC